MTAPVAVLSGHMPRHPNRLVKEPETMQSPLCVATWLMPVSAVTGPKAATEEVVSLARRDASGENVRPPCSTT